MANMNKKGFSLIEIIAAIAILSIIMLMFVTVFTSVMKTSVASVNANEDSLIAQGELEGTSVSTGTSWNFSLVDNSTAVQLKYEVHEYKGESNGVDYYEFK